VADRKLVARAVQLWDELPSVMQEAFNVLFWESGRFYRYCQAPSSMRGHHDTVSGNLRHSVDTAEAALSLSSLADGVHLGVLTLAALLHDAGKADEYRRSTSGKWQMTNRGALLGHKITIVEWLAVARSKMRQGFPENQYLSLQHALTAVQGASSWGGLRQAMTPEANILAAVDRASGQGDLMPRHQSVDGGWGYVHPHLKCKPFSVEALGRNRMRGLEALKAKIEARKNEPEPADELSLADGKRQHRKLTF
jgi:3'-5' exoribonuclease